MSRYIDFDFVKSKKRLDLKSMHHSVWMQDIYSAPSIDIVRCKECRYWNTKGCRDGVGECEWAYYMTKPDDFCSYGERSE